MTPSVVFAVQTTAALAVYALLAWWYVWPWLGRLPLAGALIALLWIHALRTLGLTVLVPTVVDPSLPPGFALGLADGDLLAAALALAAILALRARWPPALALVWLFSVAGMLDLANAAYQGVVLGATESSPCSCGARAADGNAPSSRKRRHAPVLRDPAPARPPITSPHARAVSSAAGDGGVPALADGRDDPGTAPASGSPLACASCPPRVESRAVVEKQVA